MRPQVIHHHFSSGGRQYSFDAAKELAELKSFNSLLKSSELSDVTLVVNGGELKAHKCVLSGKHS